MKNEEMMKETIIEVSREQMEKVRGGKKKDDEGSGHHNKLNGPFCTFCHSELKSANGSYKCMRDGCPLKAYPQEGTYN